MSDSATTHVLLVSGDLLAASQIEGYVTAAASELRTSSPASVESDPGGASLVLIDLASASAELSAMVKTLRSQNPLAIILAYGPHVQEGRLKAAEEAGCDHVLTRGQFHNQGGQLIANALAAA